MRDHQNLRAFQHADELDVDLNRATKSFPWEETFGLTSQLRRAMVSVTSSMVDGYTRGLQPDLTHFLDMAIASAREVEYQLSTVARLGYLSAVPTESVNRQFVETSKVLYGLIRSPQISSTD